MTEDSLSLFDPLVARWFSEQYGAPTETQARAWQAVARSAHVLISAPTGSGKTMAAFLWALNQWITGRCIPTICTTLFVQRRHTTH